MKGLYYASRWAGEDRRGISVYGKILSWRWLGVGYGIMVSGDVHGAC